MNWTYKFALNVGGRTLNVRFNDWLFLLRDGVMLNRAEVTKFGVLLGEVMLFFRKLSVTEENRLAALSSYCDSRLGDPKDELDCHKARQRPGVPESAAVASVQMQ